MSLGISEAARLDLVIDAGTDFKRVIAFSDSVGAVVPLTGFTGRAALYSEERGTKLTDFVVTIDEVAGTATIDLAAADLDAIQASNNYVWSLKLIDSALLVDPVYFGRVTVRWDGSK